MSFTFRNLQSDVQLQLPTSFPLSKWEEVVKNRMGRDTMGPLCVGPDATYLKLVASDGHEFIVRRDHALGSGTIKCMISGPGQFLDDETNELDLKAVNVRIDDLKTRIFTTKNHLHNSRVYYSQIRLMDHRIMVQMS